MITSSLDGGDISTVLASIFSLAVTYGTFPSRLKTSVIMSIRRKGTRLDPTNCRPIKHTLIASRTTERLTKGQRTTYLMDHKHVNISGNSFLLKKSYVMCMADWLDTIKTAADAEKSMTVAYLDMTKALDRVSRRSLINKVKSYRNTDPILS